MSTRSAHYRRVLGSPRWRATRALALRRAGNRCERCGARSRLDGHHWRGYRMLGHEVPADIKMLCHDCHLDAHGRGRAGAVRRTLGRLVWLAAVVYVFWNVWPR